MVFIPEDLLIHIIRRVSAEGFRFLGPFIAASKQTNNAAFSKEVLLAVDLSEFLLNTSLANKDSVYRPFFMRCVEAGNGHANQLEGLRILCQEGPSEAAFSMLNLASPASRFAPFVIGVFRICSGDFETGMASMLKFWDLVGSLDEAVQMADLVIMQIATMGTAESGLYNNTHSYPLLDVPHCTYITCAADSVCEECFTFWYSLIVRSIC
ncbi:hypothetical protein ISN45_Aa06g021930 [Arabidopsis thaliana x Arabidopsis arenosa]|uniref:Uncharacterized protein n=1 Tax=Arabidopsis thaliana x Arabidopsis arenosa TaxID=1240361 RepID=A0A8T1YZF1_9BRAS|nr:hypothetical protein ISN45_Aa06g021930 [Arabidopsis thaliana x Arabidopsis arenosa]